MKTNIFTYFFTVALAAALFACGVGSDSSSSSAVQTQSVGGTVSGLSDGQQLVLSNKDQLTTVGSDGTFLFPRQVPIGSGYRIFLAQQPANQVCDIVDQSGTVSSENVSNVQIHCVVANTIQNYLPPVGCGCMSSWTYKGQTYTGGICANPDSDPNGPWCKTTSTCNGNSWAYCSVSPPQATFTVGGKLSGMDQGSSITIQNNGGDNLSLSANGNFTFATSMAAGASYAVTILSTSLGESCTISNGAGTVSNNVDSVIIDCGYPNAAPASCTCKSSWSYAGLTLRGCANPDSDPNGLWCDTVGICNGQDWAYCSR